MMCIMCDTNRGHQAQLFNELCVTANAPVLRNDDVGEWTKSAGQTKINNFLLFWNLQAPFPLSSCSMSLQLRYQWLYQKTHCESYPHWTARWQNIVNTASVLSTMKPILLWGGCRWAPTSQTGQRVDKRQPTCSEAASRLCHRKWSLSHADHSRESPYPNLRGRERVRQADWVCLNERSWEIIVRRTRHYKGRNGNIQRSVWNKIRPIHSNKTFLSRN